MTRLAILLLVALGCARTPRVAPLRGSPAPANLPRAQLPPGHRQVIFRWEYRDGVFGAKGEGVARLAPPDSARLDFFVDNGMGGGFAIMVGDSISTPGGDDARRYLPTPPLLWGALGRLAVPAAPDSVAAVTGDTLRADIGRDPAWRVTFVGPRLARIDRIAGGRVHEWIARGTDDVVRYAHEGAGRRLTLTITRTLDVAGFDPDIWR